MKWGLFVSVTNPLLGGKTAEHFIGICGLIFIEDSIHKKINEFIIRVLHTKQFMCD